MGNTLSTPDLRWENHLPPGHTISRKNPASTFRFPFNFSSQNHPPTRIRQLSKTYPPNNDKTYPEESNTTSQWSQKTTPKQNSKPEKTIQILVQTCFVPHKPQGNQEISGASPAKIDLFRQGMVGFCWDFPRNGSTKSLATMGEEALRLQLEQRLRAHGPSSWAEALAYEVTRHWAAGKTMGKMGEKEETVGNHWAKMGEKLGRCGTILKVIQKIWGKWGTTEKTGTDRETRGKHRGDETNFLWDKTCRKGWEYNRRRHVDLMHDHLLQPARSQSGSESLKACKV